MAALDAMQFSCNVGLGSASGAWCLEHTGGADKIAGTADGHCNVKKNMQTY